MKIPNKTFFPIAAALCLPFTACKKSDDAAAGATDDAAVAQKAEAPEPREEFELTAKAPAGKRVDLQVRKEMIIDNQIGDAKQPTQTINLTLDLAHSVKAAAGEGASLPAEVELSGLIFEMKTGDEGWTFDSAQPTSDDVKKREFKDLRKSIGGKMAYALKADGSLDNMNGYQDFVKSVTRGVSKSSRGMLGSFYSQPEMTKMLPLSMGLPGKPVAEGDSWNRKGPEMSPVGPVDGDKTFTFKGWSELEGRKVAVIGTSTVYKKHQPQAAKAAASQGDRSEGGDPGMEEGMDEGRDEGMSEDEMSRAADMGGAEPGMEGGEPGGGAAAAPAKPEADESELGPGELGKASGTIYFDPELGVVVEVSDKQMFRLSQSAGGRTYTRQVEINLASKVRKLEDAAAQ